MRHPVNDLFPIMENEGVWKSALEEYLDDGGDVNHHNVFLSSPHLGKTLLIRAIELNNVPIIKKLLDVKANPNICHSKTLQSPLSIMLSNVNPDHDTTTICKILLDAGADADKVDEFTFMSPLYHMLSTPVTYNAHHALMVRLFLGRNAISAFKSHPNYVIGEETSLDTPRTIVLHQNPAFILLANDKQPPSHHLFAVMQFLIKKAKDKTYIQLYNFFPSDKAARTLDKYSDCTLFQHLVMCNNRVYPFTPLTYLFTPHCRHLPSRDLVHHVIDNSDATLHPDIKFLQSLEKLFKETLADNKILNLSRPNAAGHEKNKDKSPVQITPDPRLIYQTYADLGFNVLNDIVSHPSPYDDNTLNLIQLLFQSDSFKTHYKRCVLYRDDFVRGYFDYKTIEQYKKQKAVNADGNYQLLLYDPAHEERYGLPNRIVLTPEGEPEFVTDLDSDQELFVVELSSDPFFINVNNMCQSYYESQQSQQNGQALIQAQLHHGAFNKNTLFFPNGVGEQALVHGLTSNGVGNNTNEEEDEGALVNSPNAHGLVHRPFDDYFSSIYELLLSHTVSLHLTKEQLEVGRELMAAQEESEDKKKKKEGKDKKRDKSLFNNSDVKSSTENHNYMYRASGALLLAIRGRTQPSVDFIEYLIHIHHATTTISMFSFHNIFLWLLSSCQDLDIQKFRHMLTLLLDDAGCDVLSVKYQQRMHQLTQKNGPIGPDGQPLVPGQFHPEPSTNESSRLRSVTHNQSQSGQRASSLAQYDPHSLQKTSLTATTTSLQGSQLSLEESVSKKGSRSLFSRFTSIFQAGPSALVSKTLAKQYAFDYFSIVLLYCLTSPRITTYLYIYTLMTTLHDRLITHQSQLAMSLTISRDTFRQYNRDHIHSHIIEYSPLFSSDTALLNEKKHVANTLLLYFIAFGNLRLHASHELYTFLLKHQPSKLSTHYLFIKCFFALIQEQYMFEYKNDPSHHQRNAIINYHDELKRAKVDRFGDIADGDDDDNNNHNMTAHFETEDEEERLMLNLKINPLLLLVPRSPLFTESGHHFFDLLVTEYWSQEVKYLRQQYHYDDSALTDVNNYKNQQYNEQFTLVLTNILTCIVNSTIFSPQDGIWLYKVLDKFLTTARADILSQRQELNSKLLAKLALNPPQPADSSYFLTKNFVHLDSDNHYTDMSWFTHSRGIDFAYSIDCTRLFHSPIPISSELVRALSTLLAEQYHTVLIYYQQYFYKTACSPLAYHIVHSVLENPSPEELPTTLTEPSHGLPLNTGPRHNVIIVDHEDLDPAVIATPADVRANSPSSHKNGKSSPRDGNNSSNNTSGNHHHHDDEHDKDATLVNNNNNVSVFVKSHHYGRISLATDGHKKLIDYDPASPQSVINATYATVIRQIELSEENLLTLRNKKTESFMRYRGPLPAVYGILRGTSQQALTPTWFRLFDLLAGECRDIHRIARQTRTSPLSLFFFSTCSFDNNSLAAAKWLLQPPITIDKTETNADGVIGTTAPRAKLTKVSDFINSSLSPPPPHLRCSITSTEYQTRQYESITTGENQHFDYVEALYALVTSPAQRHNQVYKFLLEKVILFIHPDDLNLFSFDPNSVLTQQELQQQTLTYQEMFLTYNMNKSIVSQYLSHLSSPTQTSIDILHILIRAGGKVHLANPTTNQSPLIYFIQQQTHQENITKEFFDIFLLLFQNYGHCGVLLLTTEHRTLFELALTHVRVMDAIGVNYLLLLLSTSHISYRHSLAYPDVMSELALLERNKNKRLMAPVLAVDRADGLWSRTHKLIDSAWVEPTGNTLFSQYTTTPVQEDDLDKLLGVSTQLTHTDSTGSFGTGPAKRSFVPSTLTREEFSTLFDFYYSMMYFPSNTRYYSVVHALANHRDQHIVATIFGNVPNHDGYLYYSSSTKKATLKEIIIAALAARKKELNNHIYFTVNLEIVDCIDNVEPIQIEETAAGPKTKGKQVGLLFQKQQLDSATPNTAPAIPEWATALSDTMHLNFSRKRQQRTVRDGTEGLFWYIINNVQDPLTEDIQTLLDGCFDDQGKRLSTPVSYSYVNFNNETPMMHAVLRRWREETLIYLIEKIGAIEILKERDNNGRSAYDYMVACATATYAPKAVQMLHDAKTKM